MNLLEIYTDSNTVDNDRYRNIPKNIEYIIIDNDVYKNGDEEFEYMKLMSIF